MAALGAVPEVAHEEHTVDAGGERVDAVGGDGDGVVVAEGECPRHRPVLVEVPHFDRFLGGRDQQVSRELLLAATEAPQPRQLLTGVEFPHLDRDVGAPGCGQAVTARVERDPEVVGDLPRAGRLDPAEPAQLGAVGEVANPDSLEGGVDHAATVRVEHERPTVVEPRLQGPVEPEDDGLVLGPGDHGAAVAGELHEGGLDEVLHVGVPVPGGC